jgi:hypothetical protein
MPRGGEPLGRRILQGRCPLRLARAGNIGLAAVVSPRAKTQLARRSCAYVAYSGAGPGEIPTTFADSVGRQRLPAPVNIAEPSAEARIRFDIRAPDCGSPGARI